MRPHSIGLIVMIGLAMLAVLALDAGAGHITLIGAAINGAVIGLVLVIGRWAEFAERNYDDKHRGIK